MAEDVSGLPDVQGLSDLVKSSQDNDPQNPTEVPTPVENGTDSVPTETQDTQFRNKDGSLNQEALLKSYREIQGYTTKVSQENKVAFEQLNQLKEQIEILRLSQGHSQLPQNTPAERDFDSLFIENPQSAVAGVAGETARQIIMQTQIESVLAEEQTKNPGEFNERYQFAMAIKNQFPQLVRSAAGVRKLFEIADNARKEELKKQSYRAVQVLFGDDVDLEKLKALAKKTPVNATTNPNLAYMPDTTHGTRTDAGTRIPQSGTVIDEAVQKGDADRVIQEIFKQTLAR